MGENCRSVYDLKSTGQAKSRDHSGRMLFATPSRLDRAVSDVQGELEAHGFFDAKLARINVSLSWFGFALGSCHYGENGDIYRPAVSMSHLVGYVRSEPWTSLRDTMRHEYGHALAHTHRALFCSVPFKRAFGTHHDADVRSDYDPERHVTPYAATSPSEDFAEVFMLYLRHRGELPRRFDTWRIRRKWRFTRELGIAVAQGQRRWKTPATKISHQ